MRYCSTVRPAAVCIVRRRLHFPTQPAAAPSLPSFFIHPTLSSARPKHTRPPTSEWQEAAAVLELTTIEPTMSSSSKDEATVACSNTSNNNTSTSSFIAGISLPSNSNSSNDDAAKFLQTSRPDGYEFCIIPLPWFPTTKQLEDDTSYHVSAHSSSCLSPRRDVTTLDSKW